MRFKDIEGQSVIANRLTSVIDAGRISHAQMFLGDSSSGTLALALAYAQYLNCTNRQHYDHGDLHADSCGECPNCRKIEQLSHPDMHLLFPTTTTATVKSNPSSEDLQAEFRSFINDTHGLGTLNEWYDFIQVDNKQGMIRERDANNLIHTLGLSSYEGGYKVAIIWMAEKMNITMANKILKSLEEPSPKTLIILCAENRDKILSTIISRTQLTAIPAPHVSHKTAAGSNYAELFVTWMRQLFKLNMASLSAWVDTVSAFGREQQKQFLLYAQEALRQCFLANNAGIPLQMDFGDNKFNNSVPSMITPRNAEGLDKAFNDAFFAIERNAYHKITFMQLSFTISKLLKKR